MKLASIANYGFVLEFELTVANVEYLYNAFAASPPSFFNLAPMARKKLSLIHISEPTRPY